MHHLHFDPRADPKASKRDDQDTYFISNGYKRSGPIGALLPKVDRALDPVTPLDIPSVLSIVISPRFCDPSAIYAPYDPPYTSTPLYHLRIQTAYTPHIILLSGAVGASTTECASATLAHTSGDVAARVNDSLFSLSKDGRCSRSSFTAKDVPGVAGGVSFKGDKTGSVSAKNADGREIARLDIFKPIRETSFCVTGKISYFGKNMAPKETKEALLVTALAIREYKRRGGREGIWRTIGSAGISSSVI